MDKGKVHRSTPRAAAARVLALLLVICLAECSTGSCLSYGHSCWGAHGKRSGKPQASAPDWYLTRILSRMAANAELNRARQATNNDDFNAIYQMDIAGDSPATDRLMSDSDDGPVEIPLSRNPEAKPMLDEGLLSKMKIWQMMRDAPEE